MRKRNTESLAEVIVQVLKSQRLDRPLNEKRLVDAWPIVLGSNIMNYTTDLIVKNRTLYVSLSSSVLRHDLFISRVEIKNSLNKHVGVDVINDIVFK